MKIYFYGNKGHSHSYAGCFPFLPISIPIPNFVISSHSHGIPIESHFHGHLYRQPFLRRKALNDDDEHLKINKL